MKMKTVCNQYRNKQINETIEISETQVYKII